jgi:hypothetical protein
MCVEARGGQTYTAFLFSYCFSSEAKTDKTENSPQHSLKSKSKSSGGGRLQYGLKYKHRIEGNKD